MNCESIHGHLALVECIGLPCEERWLSLRSLFIEKKNCHIYRFVTPNRNCNDRIVIIIKLEAYDQTTVSTIQNSHSLFLSNICLFVLARNILPNAVYVLYATGAFYYYSRSLYFFFCLPYLRRKAMNSVVNFSNVFLFFPSNVRSIYRFVKSNTASQRMHIIN